MPRAYVHPTHPLLALAVVSLPGAALAQDVGIAGAGLGCNFATLASAVAAAAPGSTLYLRSGVGFNEALVIDKDLTLVAGNSTCNAASSGTHPFIDGLTIRRPLEVTNGADVVLDRVDLARGAATEGGNARVTSGSLTLRDSAVYLGVATDGGGVYVDVAGSARLEGATSVTWNVASGYGGGVYVAGDLDLLDSATIGDALFGNAGGGGGGLAIFGGTATMQPGAAIVGNSGEPGGGVLVEDLGEFLMLGGRIGGPGGESNSGCGVGAANADFVMLGGEIAYNVSTESGGGVVIFLHGTGAVLGSSWIHHNTGVWGGGINVHEAESFVLEGDVTDNTSSGSGGGLAVSHVDGRVDIHGANILRNTASGDGGGAYLTGASEISIVGTWINENVAGEAGGGIYFGGLLLGGALIDLRMSGPQTVQEGCDYRGAVAQDRYCSELRGNEATIGGGWNSLFSDASIEETAFIGNRADQGAAVMLPDPTAWGLPNALDLKNVLLARNESPEADVVRVEDGAELTAAHLTMTRDVGTPLHYLASALGGVRRSIIWEDLPSVVDAPLVLPAACTSFNAVSGATSGVNRAFGVDPQFVVTPRGHYRLDAVASPNSVDRCSAGASSDLDSDPRPAGPALRWDRGAFEAQ